MLRVIEDTKLTNIADAIREKNRTEEQMTVDVMPDAIRSIQTASGEKVQKKDVNFYDYDGEILYSYTAAETAELTDMPALPTREGLICQGWNQTLDYVKAYTADYGKCDIGATYITDDGKTRLYIEISEKESMDVSIYFNQTVSNGVTIDFGDGSALTTIAGTGDVNITHKYSSIGSYVVTLDPADGCSMYFGGSYGVMGASDDNRIKLKGVRIGRSVTNIGASAFRYCISMKTITIPNGITYMGKRMFAKSGIIFIVFPRVENGTSIAIKGESFSQSGALKGVVIPEGYTFDDELWKGCYALERIIIPNGVSAIKKNTFNGCCSLTEIIIPKDVGSISSTAFLGCNRMSLIDLRKHETVPILSGETFGDFPIFFEIWVSGELEDVLKTSQYWDKYANHIMGPAVKFLSKERYVTNFSSWNEIVLHFTRGWRNKYDSILSKVISLNENIVTVDSFSLDNATNTISCSVSAGNIEGNTLLTATIKQGDYQDELSFEFDVFETIPDGSWSVEAVEGATYGFLQNSAGYYESQNNGVSNSAAVCKVKFNTKGVRHLLLDCICDGESYYDFGLISNVDTELVLTNAVDSDGVFCSFEGDSPVAKTLDFGLLDAGDHFIFIKYRKNGASDEGHDSLQFRVRME